jgi:hypothetical protein
VDIIRVGAEQPTEPQRSAQQQPVRLTTTVITATVITATVITATVATTILTASWCARTNTNISTSIDRVPGGSA